MGRIAASGKPLPVFGHADHNADDHADDQGDDHAYDDDDGNDDHGDGENMQVGKNLSGRKKVLINDDLPTNAIVETTRN